MINNRKITKSHVRTFCFLVVCGFLGIYTNVFGDEVGAAFSTPVSGDVLPWKHENFDAEDSKFTFAVFADLTGGERPRIFDIAVAQLNLLRPELIMNVGDLIEGDATGIDELNAQWDIFDERAAKANAPIFYAGGNHDLTGDALRIVWEARNGPRYYHFVYKDVLFLVLDTEDNTSERVAEIFAARNAAVEVYKAEGMEAFQQTDYWKMPERTSGTISQAQSSYIIQAIEQNPDVRWTFMFVHKPAWTNPSNETFGAIESALSERPYSVFSGHVQAYKYLERLGRDYIQVATTGGVQFPELGRSMDHITLVTVDNNGVDIVNLMLSGILDKTGKIPLGGDDVCFEKAVCGK
jgi:hypothetical protein